MGTAMLTIMAAFAQLERDTMIERTRPGAGGEIADRQRRGVGLAGQPTGDVDESGRQQLDVEDVGAVAFFGRA